MWMILTLLVALLAIAPSAEADSVPEPDLWRVSLHDVVFDFPGIVRPGGSVNPPTHITMSGSLYYDLTRPYGHRVINDWTCCRPTFTSSTNPFVTDRPMLIDGAEFHTDADFQSARFVVLLGGMTDWVELSFPAFPGTWNPELGWLGSLEPGIWPVGDGDVRSAVPMHILNGTKEIERVPEPGMPVLTLLGSGGLGAAWLLSRRCRGGGRW